MLASFRIWSRVNCIEDDAMLVDVAHVPTPSREPTRHFSVLFFFFSYSHPQESYLTSQADSKSDPASHSSQAHHSPTPSVQSA